MPKKQNGAIRRRRAAVGAELLTGELVEMIHRKEKSETAFLVGDGRPLLELHTVPTETGEWLVPYSPQNNLLTHNVVLFPSAAEEYGSTEELLREVRDFIHRYVDLSTEFEELAAHYILLTWIYDDFDDLPYLRVRGDYGSGKSRFLLTVGSLCYKPIFASGASSVSPLFRLIDGIRGTLVIDEADFRFTDEKAEIVKILNNGSARGFPVLRSEATPTKEFNPRAFIVYGPKLVATRREFDDPALESRCLTEIMGTRRLRSSIPLNLPRLFRSEAERLRNRLLMYRFRNARRELPDEPPGGEGLEPRMSQIFAPLLATAEAPEAKAALQTLARVYSGRLRAERVLSVEVEVLAIIQDLRRGGELPTLAGIAEAFSRRFGTSPEDRVTPRWIGGVLRKRLGIIPEKSHGTYIVPVAAYRLLDALAERYRVDEGDVGDEPKHLPGAIPIDEG